MSKQGNAKAGEKQKSRIVLVDDHPIVRDGLRQMMGVDDTLTICGEASDAESALDVIKQTLPELALVDVFLEGTNGIELTKMLIEQFPDLKILILSMHDESLYAERAMRAGASGYVMKQEASSEILDAIHTVLRGDSYMSAAMKQAVQAKGAVRGDSGPTQAEAIELLSERELAIFKAFAEGLERTEVAEQLNISVKTVETHRSNIKNKLNLGRSTDLTDVAQQWLAAQPEP